LNITAGTGAGTGDITFNGPVSIGGESISTFTASRNINIYNTISVNGTTSASGLALVYNKANSTGDYNLGLTTSGSGANVVASFLGAIDFASTNSSFSTQNNLSAKNYILVDAFTSSNPSITTFYCSTTAQCGTNAQNFALARNIDASTFTTTGAVGGAKFANMRAVGTNNATYSGTFIGLGHTITGLGLSGTSNVGLFQSTSGVTMRDIRISGAVVSGGSNTGTLLASAGNSMNLSNLILDGNSTVTATGDNSGGLMGSVGSGNLTNAYVLNTNITGTSYVGGVAGSSGLVGNQVHKVGNVTGTGSSKGPVLALHQPPLVPGGVDGVMPALTQIT
jgi:hypothetical protein